MSTQTPQTPPPRPASARPAAARTADLPRPESFPRTGHCQYPVPPEVGQGWLDICAFDNGLMLGRMQCDFRQSYGQQYQDQPGKYTIGLMLRGRFQTARADERLYDVHAGDVYIRHIDAEPIQSRATGSNAVTGLSLDLPLPMAEALHDEGAAILTEARRRTFAVLTPGGEQGRRLGLLGQRLFAQPTRNTALSRIELESMTLDLLAQLLQLPTGKARSRTGHRRWQSAVDTAIDVLQAEWDQPLTIAELSRRAGINECYLKALFRERTGQTIIGYLRQLRMEKARQLLASGQYAVKEAAFLAGYASSGKFAQAFQKAHGYLPSSLPSQPPAAQVHAISRTAP